MPYAELHCLSNFSFQRGASSARELFERARAVGYGALAITDECSLAGIVRAFEASRETGVPLIVGSEFRLDNGLRCVLLVRDQAGYSLLCALITQSRRRASKGRYQACRADWELLLQPALQAEQLAGQLYALWLPGASAEADLDELRWLQQYFGDSLRIAVELHRGPEDRRLCARLQALGEQLQITLVACGDVRMHVRGRRALLDVLTATALKQPLSACGHALQRNGERHLRRLDELQALYRAPWLAETERLAAGCRFQLDRLHYEYPHELVPTGLSPSDWLRQLTEAGLQRRWPPGVPAAVRQQIEHELALIGELRYEHYFLTVEDIVRHARKLGILCQGRGSAANSAVCYALGITEVDPARGTLLFERFISRERNEPPDIDVDFEHERREEVIQYIYGKYGRERAALAATVICYRAKSAIRDVGRALGLPLAQIDQITRSLAWWDGLSAIGERLAERGLDADAPVLRRLLRLVQDLVGFPRHLSQHVGGFVISHHPLHTLVPVENAAMPDRTIIQWDKDDLESLRLLKVDCLALGMLSAIRRCFEMVNRGRAVPVASSSSQKSGEEELDSIPGSAPDWPLEQATGTASAPLTLATIPPEDPATYDMICAADTVGVFQIESRAQMSMLPRLRPRHFYDLVIEVAIVRPGPIQGRMVHPYLRRRQGLEKVDYPSDALRQVFERTLGVPIFQEQVMQLAIVAAGFSPGEADQLRRSMAAWKRHGGLEHFRRRIVEGMAERGYATEFAEQVFEQIKGFGSYGFPESHAASFALLVYASAWLKRHHPAAFCAALINAQPMGFYSPDQLIQDARRHGVAVRPVDVRYSGWDCGLEARGGAGPPGKGPGPRAQGPEGASVGVGGQKRFVSAGSGALSAASLSDDAAAGKGPGPRAQGPEGASLGARGDKRSVAASTAELPTASSCDASTGPWALSPEPCTASPEPCATMAQPSLRLGLRLVRGLARSAADRLVAARAQAPFSSVQDLAERARLARDDLQALAGAGALKALAGHRHRAHWTVAGLEAQRPLLDGIHTPEPVVPLPLPSLAAEARADYASLGLTLGTHPLTLLRPRLRAAGWRRSSEVLALPHDRRTRAAGLVTLRQRPGTAAGVTFLTLEDESGWLNIVVWKDLAERQRRVLLESRLLGIDGRHECAEGVHHLIAERLHDLTEMLGGLDARSRDFH